MLVIWRTNLLLISSLQLILNKQSWQERIMWSKKFSPKTKHQHTCNHSRGKCQFSVSIEVTFHPVCCHRYRDIHTVKYLFRPSIWNDVLKDKCFHVMFCSGVAEWIQYIWICSLWADYSSNTHSDIQHWTNSTGHIIPNYTVSSSAGMWSLLPAATEWLVLLNLCVHVYVCVWSW